MQNEFGQNVTLYLTIFHDLVFKQCFFFHVMWLRMRNYTYSFQIIGI